ILIPMISYQLRTWKPLLVLPEHRVNIHSIVYGKTERFQILHPQTGILGFQVLKLYLTTVRLVMEKAEHPLLKNLLILLPRPQIENTINSISVIWMRYLRISVAEKI